MREVLQLRRSATVRGLRALPLVGDNWAGFGKLRLGGKSPEKKMSDAPKLRHHKAKCPKCEHILVWSGPPHDLTTNTPIRCPQHFVDLKPFVAAHVTLPHATALTCAGPLRALIYGWRG